MELESTRTETVQCDVCKEEHTSRAHSSHLENYREERHPWRRISISNLYGSSTAEIDVCGARCLVRWLQEHGKDLEIAMRIRIEQERLTGYGPLETTPPDSP